MRRQTQIAVWYFLAALLAVLWLRELWVESRQVEPLPYSEFQRLLKEGQIGEIKIGNNLVPSTLAIPVQRHSPFVTIAEDHGRFRRSADLTPVSNQPWLHVAAPAVAVIFP